LARPPFEVVVSCERKVSASTFGGRKLTDEVESVKELVSGEVVGQRVARSTLDTRRRTAMDASILVSRQDCGKGDGKKGEGKHGGGAGEGSRGLKESVR
jgi:hypothetical protein